MSSPAAAARSQLANAESIRASAEAAAAAQWNDIAYRSFHTRYLRPLQAETTRFDAALAALDASLGRALGLIA